MAFNRNFFVKLTMAVLILGIAACSGRDRDRQRIEGERIAIITTEGDIQIDPVLASVPVSLPQPYVNQNWGQSGGNPKNIVHHPSLPSNLTEVWKSSIGKGSQKYQKLVSGPIVWQGVVYTIDVESTISAFNGNTGSVLWRTEIRNEEEKKNNAYGGGVAYWGGRIYATNGYGIVAALDASSGRELWRQDVGIPFRGAPTVADGRVFANTQDNQLITLDANSGDILWEHFAIVENAAVLGAASPAIDNQTVIAAFSSGELYALRTQNGQVAWQDALSRTGQLTALATLNDIDANPVIYNNRVFVGNHSGRLAAIDLRTGERVWENNIGTLYTPWIAGDYLYVLNTEGEVVCMSVRDGRVRWITQLERFEKRSKRKDLIRWVGPVLAGDRLFVSSSHGYMLTLSPYTGEILSGEEFGDAVMLPPVVANNTLYILTDDGDLYAYR